MFVIEQDPDGDMQVRFNPMLNALGEMNYGYVVARGTIKECEEATRPVTGYCPQCGQVKPVMAKESYCVPCANTGHMYRIVNSDADRVWRIHLWGGTYADRGYTREEVEGIPSFTNLNSPPDGWRETRAIPD